MDDRVPVLFINLDLEIESNADLSPLANYLRNHLSILFSGPVNGHYRLRVEPTLDHLGYTPEEATQAVLTALQDLPAPVRSCWESANMRIFDYGFDSGYGGTVAQYVLPPALLQQIVNLGGAIKITIYGFRADE